MADYCTLAELKARIGKTFTVDDTVLTAYITAASRTIDRLCRRPDGFVALTTATARTYTGSGKAWQRIDECVEITKVEAKGSVTDSDYVEWVPADWMAFSGDPYRPDFNQLPYTAIMCSATGSYGAFVGGLMTARGVPTVRVTAKWGYATTVPTPIKEACIAQASRWYKRGQGVWADTVANAEVGVMLYSKELDPDIRNILVGGGYVRMAQ